MEVVITLFLLLISIELALIIIRLTEENDKNEKVEETHKTRRDIQGTFANPLGDSYRKNKGLYVPIRPGEKMLDGDERDDEV